MGELYLDNIERQIGIRSGRLIIQENAFCKHSGITGADRRFRATESRYLEYEDTKSREFSWSPPA